MPLATSDPTLSLTWSPNDHNKLITGQAQKFLRVFDIRGRYSTFAGLSLRAVTCNTWLQLSIIYFPLMQWEKYLLLIVEQIHPQCNKFASGVEKKG